MYNCIIVQGCASGFLVRIVIIFCFINHHINTLVKTIFEQIP